MRTVLRCLSGSRAYNTHTETSDEDWIVGEVLDHGYYIGLDRMKTDGRSNKQSDGNDAYQCEIVKLISLLVKFNPNVIVGLYSPRIEVTDNWKWIVANRQWFTSKAGINTFLGFSSNNLERALNGDKSGKLGQKRKEIIEQHGYDCYEKSTTEFLTDSGWKFYDDITETDKVGALDTSGCVQFEIPINRIDKLYSGKLYILEPYNSKAVVTENHNLLLAPASRRADVGHKNVFSSIKHEWYLIPAKEVIDKTIRIGKHYGKRSYYYFLQSAMKREKDLKEFSMDWIHKLMLVGLFLSDGTLEFRNGKVKNISLSQVKKESFVDMADIIFANPIFNGRKYEYGKETIWNFSNKEIREWIYENFGHSETKHLPNWCLHLSTAEVLIIWEALLAGDGSRFKQCDVYYSKSKLLVDGIHAMLISAGLPATLNGPYLSITPYGEVWMYQLRVPKDNRKARLLNITSYIPDESEPPDGIHGYPIKQKTVVGCPVVCFEVSNGILVTRNSGKPAYHGNCKFAMHSVRVARMLKEFLECDGATLNVQRADAADLLDIRNGKRSLKSVIEEFDDLKSGVRLLEKTANIPDEPNREEIDDALQWSLGWELHNRTCQHLDVYVPVA